MIMKENLATRFSEWTVFAAILLGVLSLPAFAIKYADQPEDSIAKSRIGVSSDQALDEHDAQLNQQMNEPLFAENAAVFPNDGRPDTANHEAVFSDEQSEKSEQQKQQSNESTQESSSDSMMESNTDKNVNRDSDPVLAAKQAALERLSMQYTPNHPDVMRLTKEIKQHLANESSETDISTLREQGPSSADKQAGQVLKQELEKSNSRQESSTISNDYIIGTTDVLRIDVWREPELCMEAVKVRPDGKISIPLIGDIQASGQTPMELKVMVEAQLRNFVSSPVVTVVVLEFTPQSVSIVGQVKHPGVYYLEPSITVLGLLARAGGCSEWAKVKNIAIVRKSGNQSRHFTFNYEDAVIGNNLENNIKLENGDVVIVP